MNYTNCKIPDYIKENCDFNFQQEFDKLNIKHLSLSDGWIEKNNACLYVDNEYYTLKKNYKYKFTNSIIRFDLKFDQKSANNCELHFDNVCFLGKLDFENAFFDNNVKFYNCHFYGGLNLRNTTFKKLADFYGCFFYEKTIFFKTDFEGNAVFAGAIFKDNVLFTYSSINKNIIFRNTKFHKGLDLSLNANLENLKFFNCGLKVFDTKPDTNDEEKYNNAIKVKGIIFHKNARETYRILKKALIDDSNFIEANRMYAKEMRYFEKELCATIFKNWRRWESFLILISNKISNNYRQSWLLSIVFTAFFGLLLFLLATDTFKEFFMFEDNKYVINYFKFLLPNHNFDYLDVFCREEKWKGYIWDIVGRIIVSFGIYQFIVSFRKYPSR